MNELQRYLGQEERLIIERHESRMHGFCAYIGESIWEDCGHGHTIENALADLEYILRTKGCTKTRPEDFLREQE